jgi:mevalonate pyrophosphate decarboxylase
MNIREKMINLVEQMPEEQLAILFPVAQSITSNHSHIISSETSNAYESWVSTENDIYDEVFADDLATR